MAQALDERDVQGLVYRGYGNLRAACYLLLQIGEPAAAGAWLATLAGVVTAGEERPEATALNVAVTPTGLRKLGLPDEALAMFSLEFVDGMATAHRSRLFGDVGESAPEYWTWGGPNTPEIDLVLLLFARDESALADSYAQSRRAAAEHGLRELLKLDTFDLDFKEHFGFRDGISQPVLAGSARSAAAKDTVQPGEFLLGYLNEHGEYTPRPLLDPRLDPHGVLPRDPAGSRRADLGRNGSYLVFRQLSQDVPGFWRYVDRATRTADGSSDEAERVKLASKMIGRWPSGAPLALSPEHDDPTRATANDFRYGADDPHGLGCPIGAHLRRANPRDSLAPNPGSDQAINVVKRHRLMRRGREYGKPVDPATLLSGTPRVVGQETDDERGLHFICLCANIARQFEFILHTWVMGTKFDGLYDDEDPMLGAHFPDAGSFAVQARPVRSRYQGLPRFVSVRGGAYFFLPGLRAIRYLASLAG